MEREQECLEVEREQECLEVEREQECLEVENFAYSQKTIQQLNHQYFLLMFSFIGKILEFSFCTPLTLRQQPF